MNKYLFRMKPMAVFHSAFIACILITACLFPFLPNDLPMQFSSIGSVNWSLPKYIGVWFLPVIALGLCFYHHKKQTLDYHRAFTMIMLLIIDIVFLSVITYMF